MIKNYLKMEDVHLQNQILVHVMVFYLTKNIIGIEMTDAK